MISYGNRVFVRAEINGVTVYEKRTNRYQFYKDVSIGQLRPYWTEAELWKYLESKKDTISMDIVFRAPFHINWLIEETCNLDCIYCFAHNKMKHRRAKDAIQRTAEYILSLGAMNVGLSGGEPTMNPYLADVIGSLAGNCSISLDTNGTLPCLSDMAGLLKRANVLVRITVDAVDTCTLQRVRPGKTDFDQRSIIQHNIQTMLSHDVPLMVHTVVTQYNADKLHLIAEELLRLGVRRWQMYGVDYSEKCKAIYHEIRLSYQELMEVYTDVKAAYGNQIEMSVYFDENSFSANSVLLVDCEGKFYLDSITDGIHYIGADPTTPTLEEICAALDVPLHCKGYLWTPDSQ